jgi:hypothetical protein
MLLRHSPADRMGLKPDRSPPAKNPPATGGFFSMGER